MRNTIIYIGLLIFALINTGCPKPCVDAHYSFAANSQITPDSDSVRIGDTIILTSSIPVNLTDQRTGVMIDYSNSTDIGSTLAISKLPKGDTVAIDAVPDFNYVNVNGRIYNDRSIPRPDGVQQLIYVEMNGNYLLKVGLIPKQTGNYILGLGNGLSNGRHKSMNCEKASFDISINNTNQHFYVITEWKPDIILNDFGKKHGYAFKVY